MSDKKIMLEKHLSSTATVFSALLITLKTFSLFSIFSRYNVATFSINIPFAVITIMGICFLIPCLVLSIKMCINVLLKHNSSKTLTVWLLVIFSANTVLNIANIYFSSFLGMFWTLLFAVFTAVCCILLRIGFQPIPVPNPQQQEQFYQPQQDPQPLTLEEKIAELKRLKELYVISDEQYSEAIQKLIQDTIQK